MMKKTHIAIATVSILPFLNHISLLCIPLGLIGSVFPDYDFILGLKHRGITHTLVALMVTTGSVMLFSFDTAVIWSIAYFTHLIADSFTKMGVPLLYPFNQKYYGCRIIRTHGAEDYFILLLCFYIIVQYLL
jgi:inner membrane protein